MREQRIVVIEDDGRRELVKAYHEALGVQVWPAVNGPHGPDELLMAGPDPIMVGQDYLEIGGKHLLGSHGVLLAGPVFVGCDAGRVAGAAVAG